MSSHDPASGRGRGGAGRRGGDAIAPELGQDAPAAGGGFASGLAQGSQTLAEPWVSLFPASLPRVAAATQALAVREVSGGATQAHGHDVISFGAGAPLAPTAEGVALEDGSSPGSVGGIVAAGRA
ncbi:MAG TPA: hypothetical protein VNL18_15405 [Gemmatimonadales bacterium]|nr:hypothetical protein [Gemmatimonadales bacterium]